jgi:hypothetical protein
MVLASCLSVLAVQHIIGAAKSQWVHSRRVCTAPRRSAHVLEASTEADLRRGCIQLPLRSG